MLFMFYARAQQPEACVPLLVRCSVITGPGLSVEASSFLKRSTDVFVYTFFSNKLYKIVYIGWRRSTELVFVLVHAGVSFRFV